MVGAPATGRIVRSQRHSALGPPGKPGGPWARTHILLLFLYRGVKWILSEESFKDAKATRENGGVPGGIRTRGLHLERVVSWAS